MFFVLMLAMAQQRSAHAGVFNVDTTVDDASLTACADAAPNDCSLRGAIIKANGVAEASVINVPAGTYVLSQPTGCAYRSHQFGDEPQNTPALCIAADVTLVGAGADATIIDGNQLDHVVMVSDRTVELRGVTLRNGYVVGTPQNNAFAGNLVGGGGILNGGTLTLVDCVVSDNTTVATGGGIFNGHSLTLLRSAVARNVSGQGGGGIENSSFFEVTPLVVLDSSINGNRSVTGTGGGIDNFGGSVVVSGSTISDNSVPSLGGGIFNGNNSGVLTVTNSTISGNTSGSEGGGVFNQNSVADFNNVTVANNFSANDGGGIYNNCCTFTVANTLIAGNRDPNRDPDCNGSLISEGYNLIQNPGNCQVRGIATGNIIGQDPRLGLLADNGGLTPTHALGAGSPAIDAGSAAAPGSGGAACAALDQRGFLQATRCGLRYRRVRARRSVFPREDPAELGWQRRSGIGTGVRRRFSAGRHGQAPACGSTGHRGRSAPGRHRRLGHLRDLRSGRPRRGAVECHSNESGLDLANADRWIHHRSRRRAGSLGGRRRTHPSGGSVHADNLLRKPRQGRRARGAALDFRAAGLFGWPVFRDHPSARTTWRGTTRLEPDSFRRGGGGSEQFSPASTAPADRPSGFTGVLSFSLTVPANAQDTSLSPPSVVPPSAGAWIPNSSMTPLQGRNPICSKFSASRFPLVWFRHCSSTQRCSFSR